MNYRTSAEYKQLVSSIVDGCLLYAGAGLSRAARGLPVWSELVKAIAHAFQIDATDDIERYRLEFLEACRARDKKLLESVLDSQLRSLRRQPAAIHECISSIPWSVIVTTNFDTLIEEAFSAIRRPFVVIDSQESIPHTGYNRGTLIVKMHGSLTSPTRVLTASEYERFDLENPIMKSLLVSLFAQHPILFVGAGLSDPNFSKIYGMVHHDLRGETRPRYYITSGLPQFVEDYWRDKHFTFIKVPHHEMDAFLAHLSEDARLKVESQPLVRGLRTASLFAKTYALDQLAIASSPWDEPAYTRMQDAYTSYVQMKDYSSFTESWEQTLYGPLRGLVFELLDQGAKDMDFTYVAPGPHAPLFNDSTLNRKVDDNLLSIVLMDISQAIVDTSKWHIGQHWRNRRATLATCVCDVTGGEGHVWSQILGKLLATDTAATMEDAVDEELKRDNYIVRAKCPPNPLATAFEKSVGRQKCDFVYSEMIASFTGTAPLMAFETHVRRKFGPGAVSDAARITAKVRLLWRRYNDAVYAHQLRLLADIVRPGGTLVVALDVEKKYVDPARNSVLSFMQPDGPQEYDIPGLVFRANKSVSGKSEAPIWWVDYPYGSGVAAKPGDFEDDYFLDHRHRVHLLVYDAA